jgi:hypothetical protein
VRPAPRARLALLFGALLAVLPAGGCAWANRDNRPVWNAFERKCVPEDDTLFLVSLPLTVPGGIVAILLDTFIVHPAQVVDDAYGDAGDVWDDMVWERRYYTEMIKLPFRAVGTPIVFLISFLGRSAFDVPPHEPRSPEERRRREEQLDRERAEQWLAWLRSLTEGATRDLVQVPLPAWNAELDAAFAAARAGASSTGRLMLYERARRWRPPPWLAEPWMGLLDPDPAVRSLELERCDRPSSVPESVRQALRADESAFVRERAQRLWP